MPSTADVEPADVLVIFGITGDLAHKMTFRALYRLERRELLDFPIVGVAVDELSTAQLVEIARKAVAGSGEHIDDAVFERLAARLTYLHGDVTKDDVYKRLAKQIGRGRRPLFYLEMPPALFGPIVEHLHGADLLDGATVAVEKPFGHDLVSAQELNTRLRAFLREDQLLRVDHFLGKEPVIELEYLRFANLALAKLWDRDSVAAIQITLAEDFGVEDRGAFYDPVGALRDVVQNHLLQVLALVAMEPPTGPSADELRDRKAELLKAVTPLDPRRCVRGQYEGYADIPGVAKGSSTETFVAFELKIENWRWAGVPVFVRAGKELSETVTEVRLLLRHTPPLPFLPSATKIERNQIVLRIDPDGGLRLQLTARDDDSWRTLHLDDSFVRDLGEPLEPYERLLHAAMVGDHQLFTREDGVEATWRIVQPLLDDPPEVQPYAPGSWGPDAATRLMRGHPGWQQPWTAGKR